MEIHLKIKPLSVNQCWQGQRFKTSTYKKYEAGVLLALPQKVLPSAPYRIYMEFGFSSSCSDWDNPIKPLQDLLQKKYGFNDKEVFEAHIKKVKVKKGEEYFKVKLESL